MLFGCLRTDENYSSFTPVESFHGNKPFGGGRPVHLNWTPIADEHLNDPASFHQSVTPSNRLKHACCVYQGYIYVLGGRQGRTPLRDLCVWDPVRLDNGTTFGEWRQLEIGGVVPPSLEGHTMVPYKNQLYIFGGTYGHADSDNCPLWIYSIEFQLCRQWGIHREVIVPQARRGHTAVVHAGAMHVFGGYIDLKGSTAELWTFDFESESWHLTWISGSLSNSSGGPSPRHGHSAEIYDSAMWIYGGLCDLLYRGDLWRWSFRISQWCRIRFSRGPSQIANHASAIFDGQMLIMGGDTRRQEIRDIWSLDFASSTWRQVSQSRIRPSVGPHQSLVVLPCLVPLRSQSEPLIPHTPVPHHDRPHSSPSSNLPCSPRSNRIHPCAAFEHTDRHDNTTSVILRPALFTYPSDPDSEVEFVNDLSIEDLEVESDDGDCRSEGIFRTSTDTLVSSATSSPDHPLPLALTLVPEAGEEFAFRNHSLSVSSVSSDTSVSVDTGYLSRASSGREHSALLLVHLGAKESSVFASPLVIWCMQIG